MKTTEPPRLSTWFLERLAPPENRESLIGDLREQYHEGRSSWWYRRQVVTTILAGVAADIGAHKLLVIRGLAIGWTSAFAVGSLMAALRQSVFDWWGKSLWGESEILRQFWVWYSVPFFVVACVGFAAIGWLIARLHRRHSTTMLILCAAFQLFPATRWGLRTSRLLLAGLWFSWDYRLALVFQAAFIFVIFPL